MPKTFKIRRQAGMSYLLVLLALAGLELGLVTAQLHQGQLLRQDQERELLFIGRQFVEAIGSYHAMSDAQGPQRYPATLEDLLRDPRVPGVRRHLRRIFVDPMTGQAQWGLVKVGGRIVGVYSLSTRRPLKVAGFGTLLPDGAHERYRQWVFQYQPQYQSQPQHQSPLQPPQP